jgi:2-polyprenyl-6-hydroxyphenyl methylase/3-demethylubiquinone-9 3-methyltransferase
MNLTSTTPPDIIIQYIRENEMTTQAPSHIASVDPQEVARYRALAETWWDATGPFWPLHRLNELRVEYIRQALCEIFDRDPDATYPLENLRILDIGCGGGILSESMARLGASVHGIDVVAKNITIARMHALQSQFDIHYQTVTVEELAEQDSRYDVVLNMEVVEHVAELPRFLQACNSLVRPGGVEIIATINRNPLSWLVAIVGAEYILGWLPKGTHQWRRFRTPAELTRLLHADGLEVSARTGVKVNPFNRSMHLTPFMGVNYMLIARKEAAAKH